MWAADFGQVDCLKALVEGKADLDIKVRGVMTHGRVALLVNGLVDPLRRVPLDWSTGWCIGIGGEDRPIVGFHDTMESNALK